MLTLFPRLAVASAVRVNRSPGVMTALSVAARAFAFFAPVPFITAYLSSGFLALWFVIMAYQSFTAMVIGNLPTIFMNMVSYADADRERGEQTADPGLVERAGARLAWIAAGIMRVFGFGTAFWLAFAATAGTALIWRPAQMTGDFPTAMWAWAIFVVGSSFRILVQSYTTFLLGKRHVSPVRRLEAACWLASGILSSIGLLLRPSFVLAMLAMQLPFLVNYISIRNRALREGWETRAPAQGAVTDSFVGAVYPQAWRGTLGLAASYATVYGSSIIFAQISHSAAVASFSFAVNVLGMIVQLSHAQTMGGLPMLARLFAQQDQEELNRRASRLMIHSLVGYSLLVTGAWFALTIGRWLLPEAVPTIDWRVWLALALSYALMRYAAFHLHLYTVTNDIRWHTLHVGTALIFFATLFAIGPKNPVNFAIAQGVANGIFAIPYVRLLTWRRLGYGFADERRALTLSSASLAAGIAAIVVLQYALGTYAR